MVWPEDYEKWPEHVDDFGKWGPHDMAQVWRAANYEMARLYVNEAAFSPDRPGNERTLEASIVHELLHLVTRDMETIVENLDGLLHRDVFDLMERNHRDATEKAIDKLAYRLVDLARAYVRPSP